MPPRKKSGQEAPPAGSLAVPLHGSYYAVRPGVPETGPEYFACDPRHPLAAQTAALARAEHLAFSPVQEVTRTAPGEPARVVWRFERGQCTLRPAGVIPPPGRAS